MPRNHLVRVGAMGQVGRFQAVDAVCYARRTQVVVRTRRGLEIGEVLASSPSSPDNTTVDGAILRRLTVEDRLLEERLEKHRQAAYEACAVLLRDKDIAATLEVEHLFDGQGLIFYFLGEVTPELETYTAALAEEYEAKVQFRKFTETLIEGCGPDCGTEAAAGQGGCDSCSGCAVVGACGGKTSAGWHACWDQIHWFWSYFRRCWKEPSQIESLIESEGGTVVGIRQLGAVRPSPFDGLCQYPILWEVHVNYGNRRGSWVVRTQKAPG